MPFVIVGNGARYRRDSARHRRRFRASSPAISHVIVGIEAARSAAA
jgi:hypothetical protein